MRKLYLVGLSLIVVYVVVGANVAQAFRLNFAAHLSGEEEVPDVDTDALGIVRMVFDPDANRLKYRLIVANILKVVAAHIHAGAIGENGPVLATLFSGTTTGRVNGVLASGEVPLTGKPLLIKAMMEGITYINVHTSEYPSGEIRGQIMENGIRIRDDEDCSSLGGIKNGRLCFGVAGGTGEGIINDALSLAALSTSFNPNDSRAPAGVFTIDATFSNVSSDSFFDAFFEVVTLTNDNTVLNATPTSDGRQLVRIPKEIDPNQTFTQTFEIGLQEASPFRFFVDAFGTPQ